MVRMAYFVTASAGPFGPSFLMCASPPFLKGRVVDPMRVQPRMMRVTRCVCTLRACACVCMYVYVRGSIVRVYA